MPRGSRSAQPNFGAVRPGTPRDTAQLQAVPTGAGPGLSRSRSRSAARTGLRHRPGPPRRPRSARRRSGSRPIPRGAPTFPAGGSGTPLRAARLRRTLSGGRTGTLIVTRPSWPPAGPGATAGAARGGRSHHPHPGEGPARGRGAASPEEEEAGTAKSPHQLCEAAAPRAALRAPNKAEPRGGGAPRSGRAPRDPAPPPARPAPAAPPADNAPDENFSLGHLQPRRVPPLPAASPPLRSAPPFPPLPPRRRGLSPVRAVGRGSPVPNNALLTHGVAASLGGACARRGPERGGAGRSGGSAAPRRFRAMVEQVCDPGRHWPEGSRHMAGGRRLAAARAGGAALRPPGATWSGGGCWRRPRGIVRSRRGGPATAGKGRERRSAALRGDGRRRGSELPRARGREPRGGSRRSAGAPEREEGTGRAGARGCGSESGARPSAS